MKPLKDLTDDEFAALARQAVALQDAPPALVHAAIQLYQAPEVSPLSAVAQSLGRLVKAVLSFDSWAAAPAAMAVRSADTATRHLLFSAQGRDIDLRVAPDAQQFALAGQILGPDDTGSVELSADDIADSPRTVLLDAMGEFRIDGIAGGRYVLTLRVGEDVIVLPPIDVGQRPQ